MHIGIDGYEANNKQLVGVGTFAYQVIRHLYKIDKKNTYTIFLPSAPLNHLPKPRDKWRYRIIPTKVFWTFTSLPFGIWTNKEEIDIFFSPTHYIPRFITTPRIVSIMDLSYLHYPDMFRPKDLFQLKNWSTYSIKHAKKIVTISEFTKSEIVRYYSISKEDIIVCYPGLDQKYQILRSKDQRKKLNIKNKYKINSEYILFVGTVQPRKNIIRLVDGFYMAMKQLNNNSSKLVLVGKKGWLYEEIFQKVEELDLKSRIKFLDYVSDEDISYLYKNATAFILPSLYEGFGIPVIEAMSCGVPTVVSQTSSLPEIAGDASIYIDPESVNSITDGVIKAMTLDEKEKANLIDKGLRNISRFNWENCTRRILEVLVEEGNQNAAKR